MPALHRREVSAQTYAYLLNIPSFFIVAFMIVYPLLFMLYVSLHKWTLLPPRSEFTGLTNYFDVLQGMDFWFTFLRTLFFTVASVAVTVVGGLAMALVLNEAFKGRSVLRALVLVPWAIPPISNTLMWKWVLHPQAFGALNWFLTEFLHLIDKPVAWVTDYAMLSVIYVNAYREMPFCVIVLLAAISTVPLEHYDAAKVDGAGVWGRFRHVTLPFIRIPLWIAVLFQTVWAIRVFDTVYGLTRGGPGDATKVLSWLFYVTAWGGYDFGHGSVITIFLGLICVAIAYVYFRLFFKEVFGKR